MSTKLPALELAALLCSRVCHDVVGPVGAIANGLEILEEETDSDMRKIAEELVQKSTQQAAAKLTFSRIAFGAAGSANAQISLEEAKQKIEQLLQHEKAELRWQAPNTMLPKNKVKLLLNLVLCSLSTIPRGGTITVDVKDETQFRLINEGPQARIPSHSACFDTPLDELEHIDAHTIQPIYAALLAEACAMTVTFKAEQDAVHILAA